LPESLFFFNGRNERKGNQLVPMELCLFEGLDSTEGYAVIVGLKHDPFAYCTLELEYAQERLYHVVHAVYVVVMEQDFIERNMGGMLFKNGRGFGWRKGSHRCFFSFFTGFSQTLV
jgi:hypothetical protein